MAQELITKFKNKNARRAYEIGYATEKKLKTQIFPAQIYDEEETWITNKNIDFSKCICLYCKIDLEKTSDAAINGKLRDLNKDTRTIELMKEKFINTNFTKFYDS